VARPAAGAAAGTIVANRQQRTTRAQDRSDTAVNSFFELECMYKIHKDSPGSGTTGSSTTSWIVVQTKVDQNDCRNKI
jgi:hypothetical protein